MSNWWTKRLPIPSVVSTRYDPEGSMRTPDGFGTNSLRLGAERNALQVVSIKGNERKLSTYSGVRAATSGRATAATAHVKLVILSRIKQASMLVE
jgi:hypothetical protein